MRLPIKASPKRTLLAAVIGLWISGCAVHGTPPIPAQPSADSPAVSPVVEVPEPAPVVYGQFSKDTLYALLAAEIAGQRNRFDMALNNYVEQAHATRDVGIIARALQVSEFLGARQPALEMATLWVDVAPDDPEALRAAALQLARAGEHEQAMAMMQGVLAKHGETHFDFLTLAAAQTDAATRQAVLQSLQQLQQQYPDNAQLVFATALLLQQDGREDEALALLDANPVVHSAEAAIMLHSQLLVSQGETQRAISMLQQGLRDFPDDTRMRLLLARMLIANDDFDAAAVQFKQLVEQNPDDMELLLTLGLVNLESGDAKAAVDYLEHAATLDPENSVASYHLGLAYQEAGRPDDALQAWQEVGDSNEFLTSRLQISRLLIDEQRTDELAAMFAADRNNYPSNALQLYMIEIETLIEIDPELAMARTNEALEQFELDSNLLYTRAMLAEQLGNPDGLERDLRLIIEREPDNAMALNALGFTLADRNERLEEALALIERAYALEPEDPAITDSLGWVHYRLGNLEMAEELLRQAYRAFPDQEVAAHLGEVLWHQGRKEEARTIWQEASENEPDSPLIDSTRQRLEAR
ncbi:hypothetical protein LCGC14_0178200 [marine sediment metagenome]